MQLHTGVDMLEISRMACSIQNPRFLRHCFSEEEQREFLRRGGPPNFLAGCFCVKEAFSKALGTGVRGFALPEVSVLRDKLGKPTLAFTGNAERLVLESGLSFDASITHTREYVLGFVVAYRE